jgi:outer membrane protein assembly factor BamE
MSMPTARSGVPAGSPARPLRGLLTLFMVGSALAATGCASSLQSSDGLLSRITPYKIEVVQGNVVTSEQAQAVRPGMTRAQVRDILGSPLLSSAFHADRWDYVFTIRRPGTAPQQRRVLARFDGDRLVALDTGGDLPSEQAFVASIDTGRAPGRIPTLELTEAQLAALPAARRPAAAGTGAPAPAVAPPSPRVFPPLEPR